MPLLISDATGNFTSSGTWAVAEAGTGAQLTSLTASTSSTTSYVYSSTFTGTNANVVDGVALFCRRNNTTGTFTVALSEDNGTTATRSVTVNASDIPAYESWVFFKFASTLTLDGGTDYKVGILSSSAGSVTVFRDATAGNWGRLLRTTTTAAPAAGDTMLIVGELTGAGASTPFTVTMDNTATTDFGNGTTGGQSSQTNTGTFTGIQIGSGGTLTWGTSAATNYYLKLSGNLVIWGGGTMNMGTAGTPCPRDSTMWLQFDCIAANSHTLNIMNGGNLITYGQSRTSGKDTWFCKLTSDAAINATTLNVDTDTGWLDNDAIAIAATTRTATQCEAGTLNGNAGASSLTVDGFGGTAGGLAFAHGGTSPVVAEIILLTRNVRISGATSTFVFAMNNSFNQSFGTTINLNWTEIFWMSTWTIYSSAGSDSTTTLSYCCMRDITGNAIFQSGGSGQSLVTVTNTSFYNAGTGVINNTVLAFQSGGSTLVITLSNIIMILCAGGVSASVIATTTAGNFSDITIVGSRGGGIIAGQTFNGTLNNITIHSCAGTGLTFSGSSTGPTTFDNLNVWRNSNVGVSSTGTSAIVVIKNSNIFANFQTNFQIANNVYVTMDNCRVSADSSFSTTNGINISTAALYYLKIINCIFGAVSGIYRAHTRDITIVAATIPTIEMFNTSLASSSEVTELTTFPEGSSIKSSDHDQTVGSFKTWKRGGIIQNDTTVFNTASPSERLTPLSSTIKLQSGSRIVAVDSSGTVTINVYVRKSTAGDGAAYNGNQPRLIVRRNIIGTTTDTVLDTMTVGAGTWEQLTATTSAASADGAFEFLVDCDGTAGWINIDDWSVC